MTQAIQWMMATVLVGIVAASGARAQTPGQAQLEVSLLDYNGSSAKHYTVVWVTTGAGLFIKTLRKQGPTSWTSREWGNHCGTWNNARNGSTIIDGYTSATASNYSGTNSPVICRWNGQDASGNLVADGTYRFWVQYAEDNGQGPVTTGGLLWTKGRDAFTNAYPNQGANFASMRVAWIPDIPVTVSPAFTSATLPAAAIVGVPYTFTCTASGTSPITFRAQNLPPGLSLTPSGALSGNPTTAGTFAGTVTAANGTSPDATQSFSITVAAVPVALAGLRREGASLVLRGTGPPNGVYALLASPGPWRPDPGTPPLATGVFNPEGGLVLTRAIDPLEPALFFWLRVP